MNHFRLFRKDKYYLIKYLSAHLLFISIVVLIQYKNLSENFWSFHFDWRMLLTLPLGLIIAVQMPVMIHNCVHRNLRPKWLNFLVGELVGFYVLLPWQHLN
jgi:fatty acid desaturase